MNVNLKKLKKHTYNMFKYLQMDQKIQNILKIL